MKQLLPTDFHINNSTAKGGCYVNDGDVADWFNAFSVKTRYFKN